MTATPSPLVTALRDTAAAIHATAVEKGWWETDRNDGEMLMLIVCEVAELMEALRHHNPPDPKVAGFSSAETEAADIVIRLLDTAYSRGWRLGEAIEAKMAFNRTRPYRHGDKTC